MIKNFMLRKAIVLFVIFTLLTSLSPAAFASGDTNSLTSIKLMVNGNVISPDVDPQIINNRVLLPVRWIAEPLGAYVDWDDNKKTVLVDSSSVKVNKVSDTTIRLFVAGKQIKPEVAPQVIDGRVMVPVRWVAEALGADVKWDSDSKTVTIIKNKEGYGFTRTIKKSGKTVAVFEPDEL